MSIQGGRYLEAEKQVGDIILNNPTDEAYFILGAIKSNLLLDKGRSYMEVQFCFNKYLELSQNKSEAEKNIMVLSIGMYSQLAELQKHLFEQKNKELLNIALGALVAFASSKIIDSSTKSFGVISGFVGASMGIGMSMQGISNLGSNSATLTYVTRIMSEMIEYLKTIVVNEKKLLNSEILTLSEKYGTVVQTDNSFDVSILESLGSYYVNPSEAISLIADPPQATIGVDAWTVKGGFWSLTDKRFEIPKDDVVLGGFTSKYKNGLFEFLFTKKGVYFYIGSKFKPYNEIKFRCRIGNKISWCDGIMAETAPGKIDNCENIVAKLNDFVSQVKEA